VNNSRKIGDSNDDNEMDEIRLLSYINGTMSPGEQHKIEALLEQDPFLSDAVEGLAEVKDKEQLKVIAHQINVQLRKQITNRRQQRRKSRKLEDNWGWIFVVTILLLLLISWLVIKATVN